MGPGTVNTSSFTPFKGAYMHFFFVIYREDTADEQVVARELQDILAPHVTSFYPYPNLANDPDPGEPAAPDPVRSKASVHEHCGMEVMAGALLCLSLIPLQSGLPQASWRGGCMCLLCAEGWQCRLSQPLHSQVESANNLLVNTVAGPQPASAAEAGLATKVGGAENLRQLQHLKYLVDPDNFFVHHQLQGLEPAPLTAATT